MEVSAVALEVNPVKKEADSVRSPPGGGNVPITAYAEPGAPPAFPDDIEVRPIDQVSRRADADRILIPLKPAAYADTAPPPPPVEPPANPRELVNLARELRELGRTAEAESVLSHLCNDFPENSVSEAMFDFAMIAYSRKDWSVAIERFERLHNRFPDNLDGHRFLGDLLIGQHRFDEADVVLRDAISRYPQEVQLAVSYAWSAHLKGDRIGDWQEASVRWYSLLSQFPSCQLGYAMFGLTSIRYLNNIDEAESVLRQGMERFPHDAAICVQYARAADYRGNRNEALRRWEVFAARFPDDAAVMKARGEIIVRRQFEEIDRSDSASPLIGIEGGQVDMNSQGHSEKDILMQFESLGENCEFGLVQRHFGAEPLGLLRWVSMKPEALCLALESRFQELEDPKDLKVKLIGPEFHMFGSSYEMQMHTFMLRSEYQGSLEQLHLQLHRRLVFLRRKLLDDLDFGERILVWQSGVGSLLTDETIFRMHNAVSAYGDNTLLVVRRHNNHDKTSGVERIKQGLLVAGLHQVDKLIRQDGAVKTSSPFSAWLKLCVDVLSLSGLKK